jgi:hypothetical protein
LRFERGTRENRFQNERRSENCRGSRGEKQPKLGSSGRPKLVRSSSIAVVERKLEMSATEQPSKKTMIFKRTLSLLSSKSVIMNFQALFLSIVMSN